MNTKFNKSVVLNYESIEEESGEEESGEEKDDEIEIDLFENVRYLLNNNETKSDSNRYLEITAEED